MFGILKKKFNHWIDNNFRPKVQPIEGSVLYSDLFGIVEHSGIHIGNRKISNIVVEGFTEGRVKRSNPEEFIEKAEMHNEIYVSCNKKGPVGDKRVSRYATKCIGIKNFYGLIFSNCHSFSQKCVEKSNQKHMFSNLLYDLNPLNHLRSSSDSGEITITLLKAAAKRKIGATKWRLWNFEDDEEKEVEEPNVEEMLEKYKNEILNEESIEKLKEEINDTKEYQEEISDENLPQHPLNLLQTFLVEIENIDKKYEEAKEFIKITGRGYTYNELKDMGNVDYSKLVNEMKNNKSILEVVEKLGRAYISEEKKLKPKIIKRNENEVMGIHKSNDLIRLLPSELVNFEDEDLEYLFYSKYLEESLLTYEIAGKSKEKIEFEEEKVMKKGPVVACLDTSGSMDGIPIFKAKALLLTVAGILEKENRSLHIILFGSTGQIKELNIENRNDSGNLLKFLNNGFNGGTDFETPLKRGFEIIKAKGSYKKADMLMITDGLCSISNEFNEVLEKEKVELGFMIYTVICGGMSGKDDFSDEVIGI